MNNPRQPHLTSPTYESISGSKSCDQLRQQTAVRVMNQLTSQNTRRLVNKQVEAYIDSPTLQQFFRDHPTTWSDLLRELHSALEQDNTQISVEKYDQIYSLFIINGRKSDTGSTLHREIPKHILTNKELLQFASKQYSFLDSGSHTFSLLHDDQYESYVRGIISRGMIDNIHGCKYDNIDEHLQNILPKITRFLPKVFGRSDDLYDQFSRCKKLDEVVAMITQSLKNRQYSKYGSRRHDLMKLMQAFNAWGNIDEIASRHQVAIEYAHPDNMKNLLGQAGIKLLDAESIKKDRYGVYTGVISIRGEKYTIHWRAKTMPSILHKLWETPEYNNADALRDMLGMTVVVKDSVDEGEIKTITRELAKIMPAYGYIIKNKGLITETESLKRIGKKSPMYVTPRRGDTTHPNMQNLSIGGFTKVSDAEKPCGTEIQIIKKSAYEWKKKEDPYYKVRGNLALLGRGEKAITPMDLYMCLNEKIKPESLKTIEDAINMTSTHTLVNIETIPDIIVHLINDGQLLVYTNHKGEVLLVPPKYTTAFESSLIEGQKPWVHIYPWDHKDRIEQYIRSLGTT